MERGLPLTSLTWRDGQQLLIALGRRALVQSLVIASWAVQTTERLASGVSGKIAGKIQKSYPSHRACPVCGGKTFYRRSLSTIFTGLYSRSCPACGYCEHKKVKMIRQL